MFYSTKALLLVFVLLFAGCSDKPEEETSVTETIQETADKAPLPPVSQNLTVAQKDDTNTSTPPPPVSDGKFHLEDQNRTLYTVSVEETRLLCPSVSQSVVILNFFSPWSQPCKAQAASLAKLQKRYAKDILVIGVLLHPQDQREDLEGFISKEHADYFISIGNDNDRFAKAILDTLHMPEIFPVPLTVIYRKGDYERHYEGAIPIEMLEHDIKTLID